MDFVSGSVASIVSIYIYSFYKEPVVPDKANLDPEGFEVPCHPWSPGEVFVSSIRHKGLLYVRQMQI